MQSFIYSGGITNNCSSNVYVSGSADGSLDVNNSAGGQDLFLVKYKLTL
jgi:hypothetical protein